MRVPRFEQFLRQLIEQAGGEVVTAVTTFAEEGMEDPPFGLVLHLATGKRLWLLAVGTAKDGGDDFTSPEVITEADAALDPVPQPELAAGKLRVAEVDDWLRALIVNSGSREVKSVSLVADDPGYYHERGLRLKFHNGAGVYCTWHQVPVGATALPLDSHRIPEVV